MVNRLWFHKDCRKDAYWEGKEKQTWQTKTKILQSHNVSEANGYKLKMSPFSRTQVLFQNLISEIR